jgi:hypothetical protein
LIDFERPRESEQILSLEHCGVLAVLCFARTFQKAEAVAFEMKVSIDFNWEGLGRIGK